MLGVLQAARPSVYRLELPGVVLWTGPPEDPCEHPNPARGLLKLELELKLRWDANGFFGPFSVEDAIFR